MVKTKLSRKTINLEREILKKMMVQIGLCPVRSIPSIMVVSVRILLLLRIFRKSSASGYSQFQGKHSQHGFALVMHERRTTGERAVTAMAIKLMQVPGEKLLPGQEHGQTQDFLLLDSPTFFIKNAIEFAEFDAARLKSLSSRFPSCRSSLDIF